MVRTHMHQWQLSAIKHMTQLCRIWNMVYCYVDPDECTGECRRTVRQTFARDVHAKPLSQRVGEWMAMHVTRQSSHPTPGARRDYMVTDFVAESTHSGDWDVVFTFFLSMPPLLDASSPTWS